VKYIEDKVLTTGHNQTLVWNGTAWELRNPTDRVDEVIGKYYEKVDQDPDQVNKAKYDTNYVGADGKATKPANLTDENKYGPVTPIEGYSVTSNDVAGADGPVTRDNQNNIWIYGPATNHIRTVTYTAVPQVTATLAGSYPFKSGEKSHTEGFDTNLTINGQTGNQVYIGVKISKDGGTTPTLDGYTFKEFTGINAYPITGQADNTRTGFTFIGADATAHFEVEIAAPAAAITYTYIITLYAEDGTPLATYTGSYAVNPYSGGGGG
jgi:hypothetical protein